MTEREPTGCSPEPRCDYRFDDLLCTESGPHLCEPRAQRVRAFFAEVLVHTKGDWARRAFVLTDWQWEEIIRPLFGTVRWDPERERYVRRYRIAWIELGRKNGKSELAAGIVLYLLVGDDEESSEVYGAAKDTKQAGKVGEVAERMRQLSPVLARRLRYNRNARRIFDEKTHSYYEIITGDAAGELGHNPHGVVIDEVLTQTSADFWNAMRTSMGARAQPMLVALTTATDDPSSFCAHQHAEMERVLDDPGRAPHVFVYMRNTPREADPWDESNWYFANPALTGDQPFLSIQALRDEALEARNDPTKENSFRQFRLNQHVSQATRLIPMHLWDASAGELAASPEWLVPKLAGRRCFAGLDLSAKIDLTAWCLLFPTDSGITAWWRYWVPEELLPFLDTHTADQASIWARDGWLTVTEGNVIDYEAIYSAIEADARRFNVVDVSYDPWCGEPVVQEVQKRARLKTYPVQQTYLGLSGALSELLKLLKEAKFHAHGNPVSRWNADSLAGRANRDNPDLIRPVKPERKASGKRIDGMTAALDALDGLMRRGSKPQRRAMSY